jgi:hypothetical protein
MRRPTAARGGNTFDFLEPKRFGVAILDMNMKTAVSLRQIYLRLKSQAC